MKQFTLIIPCALGIEKYLSNELIKLDVSIIEKEPGKICVKTDLAGVYKLLRSSRMSERIFLEIASFKAVNQDQFYQGIRECSWMDLFDSSCKVTVDKVRVRDCNTASVSSLQAMCQKAIYDTLMRAYKITKLQENGTHHTVRIYGNNDYYKIALDLSGDALHKRGWRTSSGTAPLKETIAASLLMANVWRRKLPLIDPFCGSGTICIEAICYAANIAPNLYRNMAIQSLKINNKEIDDSVIDSLEKQSSFGNKVRIYGSDIDLEMIKIANKNLVNFCKIYKLNEEKCEWIKNSVSFNVSDFKSNANINESGIVITNPPYGERLETAETALKKTIELVNIYTGDFKFDVSCITTIPNLADLLEMKTDLFRQVNNGSSEAFIYRFKA